MEMRIRFYSSFFSHSSLTVHLSSIELVGGRMKVSRARIVDIYIQVEQIAL